MSKGGKGNSGGKPSGPKGGNWPAKNDNKSGGNRGNAPPKKGNTPPKK